MQVGREQDKDGDTLIRVRHGIRHIDKDLMLKLKPKQSILI